MGTTWTRCQTVLNDGFINGAAIIISRSGLLFRRSAFFTFPFICTANTLRIWRQLSSELCNLASVRLSSSTNDSIQSSTCRATCKSQLTSRSSHCQVSVWFWVKRRGQLVGRIVRFRGFNFLALSQILQKGYNRNAPAASFRSPKL